MSTLLTHIWESADINAIASISMKSCYRFHTNATLTYGTNPSGYIFQNKRCVLLSKCGYYYTVWYKRMVCPTVRFIFFFFFIFGACCHFVKIKTYEKIECFSKWENQHQINISTENGWQMMRKMKRKTVDIDWITKAWCTLYHIWYDNIKVTCLLFQ